MYFVDVAKSSSGDGNWEGQFRASRWFQRGWTLQELIAPSTVIFYDRDWTLLSTRDELHATISEIITILKAVLANGLAALASKMAWASRRQTTEPENATYSLFGLFDINMPLLTYSEGAERALPTPAGIDPQERRR